MDKSSLGLKVLSRIFYILIVLCAVNITLKAQSTDQSFPTPITSNQINGEIKARDIGDSRLTNYFYYFNGNQGDIFINVVTNNLNGDIDIFNAENLNPMTKIVVYADSSQNETGRVIYLRKSEKLILRIQGRTPNDDPATFTIKFAGSFLPVTNIAEIEQPKLPEVQAESKSDVIVNSVGTIIGVKPKPTPSPVEIAKIEEKPETEAKKQSREEKKAETEKEVSENPETEKMPEKNAEVVVTENLPKPENTEKSAEKVSEKNIENAEETAEAVVPKTKTRRTRNAERKPKNPPKPPKPVAPNPLENVRLIVLFKDGSKIERPMTEVLRVNVDNKGMLTIVSKDGSIGKYSILDVLKFTIE